METHDELFRAIGRLEAKMDASLERLNAMNGKIAKHEAELGKINLAFAKVGGIILTISAIIGIAINLLSGWIKTKF